MPRYTHTIVMAVTLATLACAGSPPPIDTSNPLEPLGLPTLESGSHMGYILGFSPLTDDNRDAMLSNEQRLVDAGLTVGRAQISWKDLEPSPGEYDAAALDEVLEPHLERGLAVALLLETIDSSSFEIPEDLLDDELTIVDGRRFDDPLVLDRLDDLLGWLTPRLTATRASGAGVYALMVGNEPDNTIADRPGLAPQIAGFTARARQRVRALDPDLPVSMTLTLGAVEEGADYAPPIVAASDFLSINYYCHRSFEDWSVKSLQETQADLDAMRSLADGRPILIQELGCSTGYDDGVIDVGDQGQSDWLARMVDLLGQDADTFRATYWFTLTDWSPEVAALISDPLCDEGLDEFCAIVDESVQTYGVLRWADGSRRPAFDVLLDAVSTR